MNYYVWENGSEQGPYSPHQVRRLLAERAIAGDAYWRNDQFPEWQPIIGIREPLDGDLKMDLQRRFPAKQDESRVWLWLLGIVGGIGLLGTPYLIYPQVMGQFYEVVLGLCVMGTAFFGSLAIYAIPSIVAIRNKHPYQSGIIVVNVLLGWTLLGWVGSLAWAVSPPPRSPVHREQCPPILN